MQKTIKLTAAAAATLIGLTLAGCSEAEDAADKAKDKVSEKGGEAIDGATSKAGEAGQHALDEATGSEASGSDGGTGGAEGSSLLVAGENGDFTVETADGTVTFSLGEFAEDEDALAVAEFLGARESAAADGGEDLSGVEGTSSGAALERATAYIAEYAGQPTDFAATVVAVESGSVDICGGRDGATEPRTLTVEGGIVTEGTAGDHTC